MASITMFVAALVGPQFAAATTLPPQGLYDQCSPSASGDACGSRLEQMAQGGFKVVLNYTSWDATPQQLLAFTNEVSRRGMQAIWPLNNPVWRQNGEIRSVYPKLAAACGCTRAFDLLSYVTGLLKGNPATWGWYIGDEVKPLEAPAVIALGTQVKLLDPRHPTFYVAYEHTGFAGANLRPFAAVADIVGTDVYPYGTGADANMQVNYVANLTRQIVGAAGRGTAMVVQAFDWAQHRDELPPAPGGFPDFAYLRRARDEAITNAGAALVLYYSFADILNSDDPARHWADLVQAAFGSTDTGAVTGVSPETPVQAPVANALPRRGIPATARAHKTKSRKAKRKSSRRTHRSKSRKSSKRRSRHGSRAHKASSRRHARKRRSRARRVRIALHAGHAARLHHVRLAWRYESAR